jgi:hypothetical protein
MAFGGCGSENDRAFRPILGESEMEILQERIDELEQDVGFRPLVPRVLPEGLNPVPDIDSQRRGEAVLIYYAESLSTQNAPESLFVFQASVERAARGLNCPDFTDLDVDVIERDGLRMTSEVSVTSDDTLTHFIKLRANGLCITQQLHWTAIGGAAASPESRILEQGLAIAESYMPL